MCSCQSVAKFGSYRADLSALGPKRFARDTGFCNRRASQGQTCKGNQLPQRVERVQTCAPLV